MSFTGRRFTITDALGIAAFAVMLVALYLALVESPIERVQGIHQKIFYIHVPTALVGYIAFGVVAFASVMYVLKRTERWDRIALASAELGVLFTTLMLVTGSIWGRPVWGAWWDWSDARLVTSLVMWLVYVAYLMFRSLSDRGPGTSRSAAVIGILGVISVPLSYFSIWLWTNVLHPVPTLQSSTDRPEESILLPFLFGMLAFTLLYAYLMSFRVTVEASQRELDELRAAHESS